MNLIETSAPFLHWLSGWVDSLPGMPLAQAISDPAATAILSVDVINGFTCEGPLASPRVAKIVTPIVTLCTNAWASGVRHILLVQDSHEPDAVEFAQWPAHCVRGTNQSAAVPELQALPFFDQLPLFPKNSIHSALNTRLDAWLADHPLVNNFIVVGDCTDLCAYQMAMHLRLDANAAQLRRRVLLPANCMDTYDLPLETALQIGSMPHPGDLLHAAFLYHMALNGVEVVGSIQS